MADAAPPAKKAAKAKKPAAPKAHPAFGDMVLAAVAAIKERKGSSASAIKKYILANYKVDEKKVNTFVKTTLKRLVVKGDLKQVKGAGANGSFKLAEKKVIKAKKPAAKKVKKPVAKKATKSPKKPAAKKAAVKKPAAKKAPAKPKKAAAAKKPAVKKPAAKKPAKKAAAKKPTKK